MVTAIRTPESQGVSEPFPLPAPHDGLNTRENFTKLSPTEARVLENWLPDEGSCNVRPGYAEHQTITGATSVPTLMLHKGTSAQKLIAAADDGELYDVTGTPSALTTANYTVHRWSNTNFNGWLFGVNGTDTPWRYDGSAVAATGFTGPTLTTLSTISQVRNRIWCTVNNSADVLYGGIGAVTGALTPFQLSQIASGGKCIAIGSWSRDAGDGADDLTVFIMDTGQVIIYQGDPATSFSLIGKYGAPPLVEKGAIVNVGGELVLMTVSGPIPVSVVQGGVAFSPDALASWGKVAPGWSDDYQLYKANAGWNAHFFNGIVYFNIPTGTSTTKQYVYNTRVPAWTTYKNMPIASLADYAGTLYFGSYSDSYVYRHGTGSDNGSDIITLARTGANYPTGGKRSAKFSMFRPNIDSSGPAQVQFGLDVDFQDAILGGLHDLVVTSTGSDWGDDWGGDWATQPKTRRKWYSSKGYGRAVAPALRTYSTAADVKWWSSDVMAIAGGSL